MENLYFLIVFSYLTSSFISADVPPASLKCIFPLNKDPHKAKDLLLSLQNEIYEAYDDSKTYFYKFGFCISPKKDEKDSPSKDFAAVLQKVVKTGKWNVIGRFNDTDIKIGSNWGFLEYGSGDSYTSHCTSGPRSSMLMINCNNKITKPVLKVIEENYNKISECYYLFEIEHPKACNVNVNSTTENSTVSHSLGGGSITIIIIIFAIALYLCGGIAFKKVFYNSEGVELVPNVDFWRRFGTHFSDCVECVCRPKPNSSYQRCSSVLNNGGHNNNNLTINDLDPDDDDEILVLP